MCSLIVDPDLDRFQRDNGVAWSLTVEMLVEVLDAVDETGEWLICVGHPRYRDLRGEERSEQSTYRREGDRRRGALR